MAIFKIFLSTSTESIQKNIKKLLREDKDIKNKLLQKVHKERKDKYLNAYLGYINENKKNNKNNIDEVVPIINQAFLKNEETNQMITILEQKLKK